jgi:hypothetical protein
MSLKKSLALGDDVEERTAWGIDLSTAINLLAILPRDMTPVQQSQFIECKLLFAIQQQNEHGYDITKALEYI